MRFNGEGNPPTPQCLADKFDCNTGVCMTGSSCEKFSDRECKTPKVTEPATPAPASTPGNTVDPAGSGPNFTSTPQSLQEVIQNIFNLALLVSGILAFGAVIYGAFMYTFSAGNPGMQSDARDQILQAFLGLALLLGSYLILNTLNPNLTRITLNPLPAITAPEYQAMRAPGAGTCSVLTTGPGTAENLRAAGFGANAETASRIASKESGGNPDAESGLDICSDNKPFSMGLFQVNMTVHASAFPGCGAGIFNVSGQPACLPGSENRTAPAPGAPNGYCKKYDCRVLNETSYTACKNAIKNPTANIAYAVGLSRGGASWGDWKNTVKACGL